MIMNLYRKIDRSMIQFDFLVHTNTQGDYDKEIENLGGKIYRVPPYKGFNHIQYVSAWKHLFKKHNHYRIIHGHVRSTAAIYLTIAKKYKLITIAHSHSTSNGDGLVALIKDILQIPIRYTADNLVACSRQAGEWLFGKTMAGSDKFRIIRNGIDPEKFKFNQPKFRKPIMTAILRDFQCILVQIYGCTTSQSA